MRGEVAVNVEVLVVLDVEVVQPSAQRLPARVPVEGASIHPLSFEPRVGERGHVSDVLAVLLVLRVELTIRLPALALDALHKLHRGDGATGVPPGTHEGVSVVVQLDV